MVGRVIVVQKAKKTKKHRKHDRNLTYCQFYALTHRREKNKLKKVLRHLKRFPLDLCAVACAEKLKHI